MLLRCLCSILLLYCAGGAALALEWQRSGPPGGMVISLAADQNGAAYLGTSDGHVFGRANAEEPWELRGRIGLRTDAVVSRLLPDPLLPEALFAAVWNQEPGAGGGIFRSKDGGRTWKLLGLSHEAVRTLERATGSSPDLVAGTRTGVFRSKDAGETWQRISPEGDPEIRNLDSLAIDPGDANIIYAGTYHLPWKTTDGGQTWKPVAAGLIDDSDIMSLRVDATNPERLFLSACSGIYRSENRGAQWTKLQGIPYAARRTQAIVQDRKNPQTLYAATTQGLWVTRDRGETWERTTSRDWVINSVALLSAGAAGEDRVLIGTEGSGVLVSEDGAKTFADYNDGFNHQVVRQLIGDPLDPTHLLLLMERNGTLLWESHDGGNHWIPLPRWFRPERSGRAFDPEATEKVYGSPWGWLVRSATGQCWIFDEQPHAATQWKLHFAAPPANLPNARRKPKTVGSKKERTVVSPTISIEGNLEFSNRNAYVPTRSGLLRCDRQGLCARPPAFGLAGQISAVDVSPDESTLVAAVDGKLGLSRDGGRTAVWSDLPVSIDEVLWLRDPWSEPGSKLFLGTLLGLFGSADAGVTWTAVRNGLPSGPIDQFVRRRAFLVATLREGGLFVSRDDGNLWNRADQDAERSRFTGLVETAPGVLVLGSQSEGLLHWYGVGQPK